MRSYSLRVLAERPFTQVAAVHRWMKTAASRLNAGACPCADIGDPNSPAWEAPAEAQE